MLKRIFINDILEKKDFLVLDINTNHYLKDVLRIKGDTAIEVIDKNNQIYQVNVVNFGTNKELLINNFKKLNLIKSKKAKITLASAIIKNDKMEWLIQKATELGVSKIIPFLSENTMPKFKDKNITRWQKIAISATEQCRRSDLPVITEIDTLSKIDCKNYDFAFFGATKLNSYKLNYYLKDNFYQNIIFFIGPEGGFSLAEEEFLLEKKAKPVLLAENILRAETAALACLSQLFLLGY